MTRRPGIRAVLGLGVIVLMVAAYSAQHRTVPPPIRNSSGPRPTTSWELKPSLKYDALCLLNALSGDPFYLRYYKDEYEHFHPLFLADEQAAFVALKRKLKDEGGGIVSAMLTLYFSTVDDETLPEMIRRVHDPSALKAALQHTPYWIPQAWQKFEEAAPSLESSLRALDRVGFATYWAQVALPKVQRRIAQLTPDLAKYDIIPAVERYLGVQLPSRTITVYLLAYSEPHGIRVTGLRFLTHVSYSFNIVLHNAIHESMHPPYDADDPKIREAIDALSRDPLVLDKVEHHDKSLGYNTPRGLIEEDSVQALEQLVSEQFGVARDARSYWYRQDEGIHVLAPVIYERYRETVRAHPQPYSQWLVEAVKDGHLQGNNLKDALATFFWGIR